MRILCVFATLREIYKKESLLSQPLPSWPTLLRDRWLMVLLTLTLLGVSLIYQRSPAFQLDLKSPLHARLLEGFFEPGDTPTGTVRWSTGRAHIRLANLWPNQAVRLTLALSAPRQDEPDPAKRAVPVYADVSVNSQALARWLMTPAPAGYVLDVPADVTGAAGDLFVTLQAPMFAPPNDLRPLALLVGGMSVEPSAAGWHLPPPMLTLLLLALAALCYLWLRRLGMGRRTALFGVELLLVGGLAGLFWQRALTPWLLQRLLLWLTLAFVCSEATVALSQSRPFSGRLYRSVALLFLAGAGLRLALAHTPGDRDNFIAFKMMLENVTLHGVAAAYQIDPVIGAYPPLHHYMLALAGHLYRIFVSPEFDVTSLRLHFVMKLPTLVLDLVIGLTILLVGLRTKRIRTTLLAGAAYLFNPGILYTTSYNGQLGDPLYALFVAVGMAGLLTAQGTAAGLGAAFAVLTKPQAAAFFPFLLAAGIRHLPKRQLWRGLGAGLAGAFIVLLPYLWHGTIPAMIRTVSTTIGHGPRIVSHALNLWWLAGWGNAWEIKDTERLVGALTYRTAGLILFFVVAYGVILWTTWRVNKPGDLALLGAYTGLAFFLLPTEIHENYLFPTISLLALAVLYDGRAWLPLSVLSAVWFFNMVAIDQTLLPWLTRNAPLLFADLLFPLQVTGTVINLLVLLLVTYWLLRMAPAQTESSTTQTGPPGRAS